MPVAEPFANTDPPLDASVALLDLPAPDTKRWVVRRKAIVVAAVRNGSLSLQEACRRYKLSVEEFLAWQRAIDRHGVRGCASPGCRFTATAPRRAADKRARSALPFPCRYGEITFFCVRSIVPPSNPAPRSLAAARARRRSRRPLWVAGVCAYAHSALFEGFLAGHRRRGSCGLPGYGSRNRTASCAVRNESWPDTWRGWGHRGKRDNGLSVGRDLRWLDRRAALSTEDGLCRIAGCQHLVKLRYLGIEGYAAVSL